MEALCWVLRMQSGRKGEARRNFLSARSGRQNHLVNWQESEIRMMSMKIRASGA